MKCSVSSGPPSFPRSMLSPPCSIRTIARPFKKPSPRKWSHGGRYDAHIRIRRHDGSYGNFLARGEVVLDPAGKPIRIVGSLADLTSLLQAEQKLVEQGNLLNLAQDAIMVRDMHDRFEFWNHGAEALYGWSAEEVRGRPNDDFLEYEKAVKIVAERTLLETGAWSGECRHLTKAGQVRHRPQPLDSRPRRAGSAQIKAHHCHRHHRAEKHRRTIPPRATAREHRHFGQRRGP